MVVKSVQAPAPGSVGMELSANSVGGKKGASSKKALKKQQQAAKREANARIHAKLTSARLDDASGLPRNVLVDFVPFAKFERNGLAVDLEFYARGNGEQSMVPAEVVDFCFDLTERNMRQHYEQSGWGWNALKKRRELEDEEARLLVARDRATNKLVAFMHFRFEREDDALVLYVYEIQIEQDESVARKGLGKQIMLLAELIGRKWGMDWVMLTVLNCNTPAVQFYHKLKYTVDETSPQNDIENEGCPYTILSKQLDLSKRR